MSELLPAEQTKPSQNTPVRAQERRGKRRVGVALQVRIRPLEFSDGNFEEVRTTLNASRNALYFFTKSNRYYKGMRLRITFPYNPAADSSALEDTGEVVRVHPREDGFGVAIRISQANHAAMPDAYGQAPRTERARCTERRFDLRSAFIAPVEVIDLRTGVRIQARTSDLSLNGCYIDTLNPFPAGTGIKLRIYRGTEQLEVRADVSARYAGSGMGLIFRDVTAAQRAILESWLCETLVPSEVSPTGPARVAESTSSNGIEKSRTIRLIQTLVRKGLLSHSEANELLDSPDS
jgi:PilZ domain-containing protein